MAGLTGNEAQHRVGTWRSGMGIIGTGIDLPRLVAPVSGRNTLCSVSCYRLPSPCFRFLERDSDRADRGLTKRRTSRGMSDLGPPLIVAPAPSSCLVSHTPPSSCVLRETGENPGAGHPARHPADPSAMASERWTDCATRAGEGVGSGPGKRSRFTRSLAMAGERVV